MFPAIIWSGVISVFCGILVLGRADFEATGTGEVFIRALLLSVMTAHGISLIQFGFLRLFGLGKIGENRSITTLNENIIKNKIRPDISDKTLLNLYNTFDETIIFSFVLNSALTSGVIIAISLVEYLFSHQFLNVQIVLAAGLIGTPLVVIFDTLICTGRISEMRRECKKLLFLRNIPFQERALTSFKMKFWVFIVLSGTTFSAILVLANPLNLNLIAAALAGFFIIAMLINEIFATFYSALKDVEFSAARIEKGEGTIFFSGSTDQEIIALARSINATAQNIKKYQEELEEAKTVLEVKVKARTNELSELIKRRGKTIEERTKELQEKIKELEKFNKLATGRELKMIELKKEIEKFKKELEKSKK